MTQELLKRFPEVDGIIACNDIVAISTYKVLHNQNISVPDEIQLVGFDDISITSTSSINVAASGFRPLAAAFFVRSSWIISCMNEYPDPKSGKNAFEISSVYPEADASPYFFTILSIAAPSS